MRAPRIASTTVAAALAALAFVAAQSVPRNIDRALAAQRELVAARPDDAGAHNDLANLLAVTGDRRGAEAEYLRSIELVPTEPGPRFNYGLLLLSTGRRMPAFRQFQEVVDLDPGHAWAHYQIGAIYDAWGLDRLARRAYARAFRLDPLLADSRVNPGVIDNDETTAAMLRAWKGGVSDSLAPREYAERDRIAGLLIDRPERSEEVAREDETADEGEPGGGFARVVPRSGEAGETATGAGSRGGLDEEASYEGGERDETSREGNRVLDSSDLRFSGATNQVSPGASGPRGSGGGGGRRTTRIQKDPPSSPPVFVPDPESTGRLDRRLLPVEAGFEASIG